jgi:cbb3-type cytochrome oxidase subunit 3
MWQELTRGTALLTAAAVLLMLGFFLWRVNSALRNAFRHRANYAENLRRAGRADEAAQVEAETRGLARRLPLYGKVFVLVGAALATIAALRWE